jgi:UDP-N-acetylmuramate-alanine ligase
VGRCPVHVVKDLHALPAMVAGIARRGDLVITLGAGSIGTVADRILGELRTARPAGSSTDAAKMQRGERG